MPRFFVLLVLVVLALPAAGAGEPLSRVGGIWRPERAQDPPAPPVTDARARRRPPPTRGDFVSIQANVGPGGVDYANDAANEPSIAIDWNRPQRIVIGWRQFNSVLSDFRVAGVGVSANGGATWAAGVVRSGVFGSDPVLDVDADGTFHYYSLGSGMTCSAFRSVDGLSWAGPTPAQGGDKAWMSIDRSGGLGDGHLYAAWNPDLGCCDDRRTTRSTDGGLTWEAPVAEPVGPAFGVTAVGPDGTLYVIGEDLTLEHDLVVARSSTVRDPAAPIGFDGVVAVDLGGPLVGFRGPNPGGLLGQAWVAADPMAGNRVYALASVDPPGDDPLDVRFSRSEDGGLTWSAPVRVNDDPAGSLAWQWFGTLAVAPDGRIDVVWADTRSAAVGEWTSELYLARSRDGGRSWSPNVVLTPPFDPHVGWPNQNKLGDYYTMLADEGASHVAYAATFHGGQDVFYLRIPSTDGIFVDGFETGGTTRWSASPP